MGWTPLSKAAFAEHVEVVCRLLERPELEVNFEDQDRQTPPFPAVSTGNLETVRLLLADARTNTPITNRSVRHTALDVAKALGFTAIAELIRQHRRATDELSPRDAYVERKVQPHAVAFIRPRRR
jgi:ankyrin repeat protein